MQVARLRDLERNIQELGNLANELSLENRALRTQVGGLRIELARRRLGVREDIWSND